MEFFFFEVNDGRVRKGIIGAHLVDRTAAARRALVGDDDAVERVLLGPAAGESDGDAHRSSFRARTQPGSRLANGFMPPGGRPPPILVSFFIIFLVCAYCFRNLLTSATLVPLPRAMRFRLLPLRIASLRRSSLVIELMIASMRFSS